MYVYIYINHCLPRLPPHGKRWYLVWGDHLRVRCCPRDERRSQHVYVSLQRRTEARQRLRAPCASRNLQQHRVHKDGIIILKFSRAAAQDNSEARGTLTVYDIDNDGQRRQCGPGPLAVGLQDDKEFFFCCDTCAPGQGATILSMEVDGVQLVTGTPASIYPPDTVFETPTQSLLVGGEA